MGVAKRKLERMDRIIAELHGLGIASPMHFLCVH